MKKLYSILGIAGAALVAVGTAAFMYGNTFGAQAGAAENENAQANAGPPPAPVTIANAQQMMLAPHSETPGSVVSTRDSLVAAATSGKIEWVADVGAEVEEGEVIARIEVNDAQLTRDDSAAQVNRLRARANYSESLYQRYVGLGEDAGESEASLDEMRANRDEALQSLRQAEVALERAEINLARTEVRAPFAGRIVSQEAQIGEYATPGARLVRLVDTHRLEVTARAPALLVSNINAGDEVEVLNGAQSATASIRAIVPVGDALSRMLEIRIALPQSSWYIGSPVRLKLPAAAARQAIAAPRDALVLRSDRVSVFVIDADNKAKRVDVELGVAEGDFIEVIGDVKADDRLVIRGGERLRDGQTVSITPLDGGPSA